MSVRYGIIGLGNQGTHYLFDIFEAGKAVDAVSRSCTHTQTYK